MGRPDNIIDGYFFLSSSDANKARKEEATVNKIKESIDVNDTRQLFELYIKLVSKNYFNTPVGLSFLHEMREYLLQYYEEGNLKPIPVRTISNEKKAMSSQFSVEQYEKLKKENEKLGNIKQKLVIAVVAMAILIGGMILIVITNDNLGYFNAEDKILNKYSAWEERLSNWEDELIRREELLNQ